jgi:hypothetical protein
VRHAVLLAAVSAHPDDLIAQMAADGIRAQLLSRDDTPQGAASRETSFCGEISTS